MYIEIKVLTRTTDNSRVQDVKTMHNIFDPYLNAVEMAWYSVGLFS